MEKARILPLLPCRFNMSRSSLHRSVLLWDMDGTLLDSSEGILGCVRRTVRELGLPPVPEDRIQEFIGPPLQHSFHHLCGLPEAEAQRATDIYRSHYAVDGIGRARVYDGLFDVLEQSAAMGIRHAVATNKKQDAAEEVCRIFGLDRFIRVVRGNNTEGNRKKSDMMLECLRLFDTARENALMIGDSPFDSRGAEEAGIDFLAAMYGFGFKSAADLAGTAHIGMVRAPAEIMSFLKRKGSVPE